MSDIDFDELDRAVNDVLGGTSDTPQSVPPSASPSLASNAPEPFQAPPAIERVERTTLAPAPAPSSRPVVTAGPAARRSGGRFMDVMHPSSDMRTQTSAAPSAIPTPVSQPQLQPRPQFQPTSTPTPTPTPQPVVPDIPEVPASPAWNEPLESPFLPDAKVEKRPLGGVEAPSELSTFDFQGLLDEPEEELLMAPEPQERLEATTLPDPIDFAATTAVTEEVEVLFTQPEEVTIEETPVVETAPVVEEAPAPVVVTPEQLQTVVEEPTGPTSITPQYKEQPSSNQESGAMYDTESYHQPVVQPVKKKSGWFTVIWILLLVLVGAGGGWAVYTYVLPML